MPATPAWPPKSLPRLYVADRELSVGNEMVLDDKHGHYLANVMRLGVDAQVMLFDNDTGEYLASITEAKKGAVTVIIEEWTRERESVPDLWLCAAPIKKERWHFMAEKACELGIDRFCPVRTERTISDRIRMEKLEAHMIEAAEQCERTALPSLAEIQDLSDMLAQWPEGRHLFFANERLFEQGEGSFRKALVDNPGPAAILIGPEGGFTDSENRMIRQHPQSVLVSLGPRILRAETAALAAISLWMSGRGDWTPQI
ncbi:MAG: 16S rRNA (uracil(1498)-N(3))-methyltransferase [Pseudomonadota bacterium]